MTIRETAIAKLQQLPDSLLQQVNDFIDFLMYRRRHSTITDDRKDELAQAWTRWFESVDHLEVTSTDSVSDYQQHLVSKYRQQGLEL
ncbi:hypothetical protein XM38_041850 [Halomicronema hongdechloris C2206]|uniref:DUF2281 domain-containing protein n=1 Tax=Halomicronema hongdechloris C2206 TaxID=1641165 RepID=A0A1V8NEK7_9CYAN|nr:DUF2281 domain-containing protein [Halomicronema hongdechloris]ASC73223.1 hypothetical protein XM38_041850 [Halomicronema hongdechloris C2206]